MNFKKDELEKIAEDEGIDLSDCKNQNERLAALVEGGVALEDYVDDLPGSAEKSEKGKTDAENLFKPPPGYEGMILLKMTRQNPRFEIRGITFTRDHPYMLVPTEDVDYLIEEIGGFQLATPKQADAFYGS